MMPWIQEKYRSQHFDGGMGGSDVRVILSWRGQSAVIETQKLVSDDPASLAGFNRATRLKSWSSSVIDQLIICRYCNNKFSGSKIISCYLLFIEIESRTSDEDTIHHIAIIGIWIDVLCCIYVIFQLGLCDCQWVWPSRTRRYLDQSPVRGQLTLEFLSNRRPQNVRSSAWACTCHLASFKVTMWDVSS